MFEDKIGGSLSDTMGRGRPIHEEWQKDVAGCSELCKNVLLSPRVVRISRKSEHRSDARCLELAPTHNNPHPRLHTDYIPNVQ